MSKNEANVAVKLDDVTFTLKQPHDFSWLARMGRVFQVFSQNDSGNISFGVDTGQGKLFVKAAGLHTVESVCTPGEAVGNLRAAMQVYEDIKHPALIRLRGHYPALFNRFGPSCYLTGACPEGRFSCGRQEEMKAYFGGDL